MSMILASKSPRRQELLKLLGLEFTVHTADIDEHMDPSLPPEQEVARVSAEKARAVAKDCAEEDIIISADTIVVIDGQILGKPKSEADAIRMLNLLSGRRHEVMTGLTVLSGGQSQTQVVRTGQERGELSRAVTANEIVKAYAMFERALMYDWCLCEGEYALSGYAARMMPVFLEGFHTKNADLS